MTRNVLLCAVLALGLAGCGSTSRDADPHDRGMIDADHAGMHEIEEAVKDLMAKVDRQTAKGWPAHIKMSTDTPPRPQIRVGNIKNKTRDPSINMVGLRNELLNALANSPSVYVVASRESGDTEEIMDERAYQNEMQTADATAEFGTEDSTGLLLLGELTDDVIQNDDARQHDWIFSLRLVDVVKQRVVVTTQKKMRRIKD